MCREAFQSAGQHRTMLMRGTKVGPTHILPTTTTQHAVAKCGNRHPQHMVVQVVVCSGSPKPRSAWNARLRPGCAPETRRRHPPAAGKSGHPHRLGQKPQAEHAPPASSLLCLVPAPLHALPDAFIPR
eukprot:355359-Chlamydomonas_euryale.AAC.18